MKKLFTLILALGLFSFSAWVITAQEQPATAQQPSTEEVEKEKAEREKNAYRLLDQIIDEAQSLRLVENRVRIQINAADMLWDKNQGRARGLFAMAAEGVAELGRTPLNTTNTRRQITQDGNSFAFQGPVQPNFRNLQLRTELVLTAARHDAALAYQLLASTKPPANAQQPTADGRGPRAQLLSDDNLEQTLLGRVAALDPKLAAQNAEQMLEKGQFPSTMSEVIGQLYKQDAEAADKLADKTIKKIQAANILTQPDVTALVQTLLRGGPRPAGDASAATTKTSTNSREPVLGQSAYVDLLSTVVDAALKATPTAQSAQRAQPVRRGVGGGGGQQPQQQMTEAQIEQNVARRLLGGLQSTLPMIDQYLPSKAPMVRQKMTEVGMSNNTLANLAQTFSALQGDPTADALLQAAQTAPQQMQSRLYQQAAYKAIEEGKTDQARQIANDHLQNTARDGVIQRIDFKEMAMKADGTRLADIRQSVARLQTDNEKIDMLIQVASDVQKTNQKVALQLLEDARQIVNRRANSYEQFEQQLKVAHAFASVDPSRSFEVLDPGISQLNELLSAASVLSGFEINMFRDGEMSIQGGNGLTSTVNRFGQELAVLARSDFERSESLAGRFQFAEPRIMTRMSIVQGLLGVKSASGQRIFFGNFGNGDNVVIRQE